jgi:soluble lytic murein transglycosylase
VSIPRRRHAFVAALLLGTGGAATPSFAGGAGAFFRFVDERGVIHLTDAPKHGRFERIRLEPDRIWISPDVGGPNAFDRIIRVEARRHRLPPALVKAVVATESAFDPTAVSRRGAMGLMQLMPATAQNLGVRNPFRAGENIAGGSRYLRGMWDRYQDWILALAAYNAGPSAVDRYGGVPPYPETRQYVRRVLHYYRRYHDEFVP